MSSPFLVFSSEGWGWDAAGWAADELETKFVPRFLFEREPSTLQMVQAIEAYDPALVFFPHWSWRVPSTIWRRFACINLHCTPLPYGRGGHPIENMILRGHKSTVLTAHRMAEEMDAGEVYGTSAPVSLSGPRLEILRRFREPAAELMARIVREKPTPQPQVGEPVHFSRLTAEELEQVWRTR